jgi:hypothetical protein
MALDSTRFSLLLSKVVRELKYSVAGDFTKSLDSVGCRLLNNPDVGLLVRQLAGSHGAPAA